MSIGLQSGHEGMGHTRAHEKRGAGLFGRWVQREGHRGYRVGKVERASDQRGGRGVHKPQFLEYLLSSKCLWYFIYYKSSLPAVNTLLTCPENKTFLFGSSFVKQNKTKKTIIVCSYSKRWACEVIFKVGILASCRSHLWRSFLSIVTHSESCYRRLSECGVPFFPESGGTSCRR